MARIGLNDKAVHAGDLTLNSCTGVLMLAALLPLAVAAVAGMCVALTLNVAWGVTTCAWDAGRRRIAQPTIDRLSPETRSPVKEPAAAAFSLVSGYEKLPALSRAA